MLSASSSSVSSREALRSDHGMKTKITHNGLVMQYGNRNLGQKGLR